MEQILRAYGLRKETVADIMMLYKDRKVKVCSPDGDTEVFIIFAGMLSCDILTTARYLLKQNASNVDRFNERKPFYTGTGSKQTISRTDDYGRALRW